MFTMFRVCSSVNLINDRSFNLDLFVFICYDQVDEAVGEILSTTELTIVDLIEL